MLTVERDDEEEDKDEQGKARDRSCEYSGGGWQLTAPNKTLGLIHFGKIYSRLSGVRLTLQSYCAPTRDGLVRRPKFTRLALRIVESELRLCIIANSTRPNVLLGAGIRSGRGAVSGFLLDPSKR